MKPTSLLLSSTSLLLATAVGCDSAKAAGKPNIIHIIGDDVGYDDFSCFNSKKLKTPNLDRMASQGCKFTNFYAPAATCTPSRAAVLTGRYAFRVWGGNAVLFPSSTVGMTKDYDTSIATLLKKEGYETGCIGKWHLGHNERYLPTNNGFDSYFGIPYPNDHAPERLGGTGSYGHPAVALVRGTEVVQRCTNAELAELPQLFAEEAVNFITDNSKKDKPFFLHLSNIETHTPWFFPKRFEGSSGVNSFGDAVMCLDWMIGEILDTVNELGIAENTLIVFQSDNGPLVHYDKELLNCYGKYGDTDPKFTSQRLLRDGKYQAFYEGGPRVSCVTYWPGTVPKGTVNDELIAGFDWFNTFAAMGGAEIPKSTSEYPIDGHNILPLLKGETGAKSPHEGLFLFTGGFRLQGYREGDWKVALRNGGPELYNLKTDIRERNNLAQEKPELLAKLMKKVNKFTKEQIEGEKKRQKGFK